MNSNYKNLACLIEEFIVLKLKNFAMKIRKA